MARPDADTIRIAGVRPGASARRASTREGILSEAISFPVFVGLVHWLVVQGVASLVYHRGTLHSSSPAYKDVYGEPRTLDGLAHFLVEPLRQWDGTWYTLIATQGYGAVDGVGSAKPAFWPLFPWLMDLGNRLTGWSVETVGYLIAHVSFLLALVLLYRLVSIDFDRAVARRTVVALAFFPTAFFFSAVYTESLFLLTVVGALLAARLGNWWVAGLVGALAGLTRSYGILLLLPFAVLFIQQHGWQPRRWLPNAIPAAFPLLGPAIFGWHLDRVWGDPLAWSSTQAQWDRYSSNPVDTLRCGFEGCIFSFGINNGADWSWLRSLIDNPSWATFTSDSWRLAVADSDTLELVITVLFLALAIAGLRYLPFWMSAFAIPGLVIPLYQPSQVHALMSIPRFGLALFPLFVMLALVLRKRWLALPAFVVSFTLLLLLTAQFAQWYWVS